MSGSSNVDDLKLKRKPSLRRTPQNKLQQNKLLGVTKLRPSIELKEMGDVPSEQVISRTASQTNQNTSKINQGAKEEISFEPKTEIRETDMFAGDAGLDFVQLRQQVNDLASDVSDAASKVLPTASDLNLLEKAQSLMNKLGQMTIDMATVIDNKVEGIVTTFSNTITQPALHPSSLPQLTLPTSSKNSQHNKKQSQSQKEADNWEWQLGNAFSFSRENQKGGQQDSSCEVDQQQAQKTLKKQLSVAETDMISLQQEYATLLQRLQKEQSKVEKLHRENKLLRSESIEANPHNELLNEQVESALKELINEKAKLSYENARLNRENGQLHELLMYQVHSQSQGLDELESGSEDGGEAVGLKGEAEEGTDFEADPFQMSSRDQTSEVTTSYDDSAILQSEESNNKSSTTLLE
eukprot:TRINITY_DN20319_c1_g1_i4.p1 TRINITY_DN20319_c1_g1~~TRINITY_DN20319_c1_g1_i4.p1  ORF type:complete len:425 (-),score=64.09 TRINITY_DN20319_c1_g1_i4:394-1623(-)